MKISRNRWSEKERTVLIDSLLNGNHTASEIAEVLGRTRDSVIKYKSLHSLPGAFKRERGHATAVGHDEIAGHCCGHCNDEEQAPLGIKEDVFPSHASGFESIWKSLFGDAVPFGDPNFQKKPKQTIAIDSNSFSLEIAGVILDITVRPAR